MKAFPGNLLCFSHLRWDFVYQRPQHLMTRLSQTLSVYYFEEPVFDATGTAHCVMLKRAESLWTVVPHLSPGLSHHEVVAAMKQLLREFLYENIQRDYIFWYYTPMAYEYTSQFGPALTVYDCMDELSAFKYAPPQLKDMEQRLLDRADLVFTGGYTLYEAKKNQHTNIHPFPSSIDREHFEKARIYRESPPDQDAIEGIKLGFYGVIDERFDIALITGIADAEPDWNIVLIGPVVKIDPASLPTRKNIHYLGQRSYDDLPKYLSGWDIALIPFLLNDSTRFISPTKTPEYLAAGVPVISTPIRDVVRPYGVEGMITIALDSIEFVKAAKAILNSRMREQWLEKCDAFLAGNSWDNTYLRMLHLMHITAGVKSTISIAS